MTILQFFSDSDNDRVSKYAKLELPEVPNGLTTSAHGKLSNIYCGSTKQIFECECSSSKHQSRYSCHKLECPRCYRTGSYRAGKRIAERMWGFAQDSGKNLYHMVISPPKKYYWFILPNPFRFMKEVLYPIIKNELEGCAIFYHQHRFSKDQESLEVAPHFHLIGINNVGFDGERLYKQYKMIFKTIALIPNTEYLLNCTSYELTHCSYYKQSASYRYIGSVASCKGKVKETTWERFVKPCEVCKGPIYEISEYQILAYEFNKKAKSEIQMYSNWIMHKARFKTSPMYFEAVKKIRFINDACKIITDYKPIKFNLSNMACKEILMESIIEKS